MLWKETFLSLWIPVLFSTINSSSISRRRRDFAFPDDSYDENKCSTPNIPEGVCKNVLQCEELLRKNDFEFLKQAICGYESKIPFVCCPTSGPSSTPKPEITTNAPTEPTPTLLPPTLPARCGLRNATSTKIVGGREAEVGAWPWMTAVYIKEGNFKSAQCGGALVTNKHVITASHCVVNSAGTDVLPADDFSVRLGEHNLFSTNDSSNPIDFPIKSVKHHEDFELKTYKNDIAILTIDGTVTFTERIHPICLPYNNLRLEDLALRNPFIAGWGTTAFNGPSSAVLREVQIPIWEQENCREAYKKDVNITNVYMCAGFAVGGKDACQGDSGGPLMLPHESKFYLIGIVSFGKGCARPGFPGVYTRVTEFLNWIAVNLV
ncbi:proclotting enzyme-like [Limulus polyphemus]|uniref:CLIP domain-containing serine protease n=1 Tax=Limulus polyphemus TaxID=6850 RepID=A0ABM1SBL3_LIMPO|nr:proclotting enzyme-like [Limulus polyphemus]XP_013773970.1 proclotting enzyme-like [Limulus polyphemus]XP_013773971.1 proclotting enzyme-like [Limulus polyphemus]XP_022241018.1 proclotting enzyme-like [Limulus polyphemus]